MRRRRRAGLKKAVGFSRKTGGFAKNGVRAKNFRERKNGQNGLRRFCLRGRNLANRTVIRSVFLAVNVFFVRGVAADLFFVVVVVVIRRNPKVEAQKQPKTRINAREHRGRNVLESEGCFFHRVKSTTKKRQL